MNEPGRDQKPKSRFVVDPERETERQSAILRGIAGEVGKRGWKMEISVNSALASIEIYRFEGDKKVTGARIIGATMAETLQSARQSLGLAKLLHEKRPHQKAERAG